MSAVQAVASWTGYRQAAATPPDPSRLGIGLFNVDSDMTTEIDFAIPADTHLICVHLTGSIDWSVAYEDRRYRRRCDPGTLCLARAGERPRVVYRDAHASFVHFYVPTMLPGLREARRCELIDPQNAEDARIAELAWRSTGYLGAAPRPRLQLDAIGLQLTGLLLERWSSVERSGDASLIAPARGDWRLRRAIDFLESRLAEDISLGELADAVDLSSAHLTTLFRADTGEPPHRWLMRRRFERACEMLGDPRASVTDVAHACGFASSQHLATVFRRRLGITPSEYRRQRLA